MKVVLTVNAAILFSIFCISSMLTGWLYKFIKNLCGEHFDEFFFLILAIFLFFLYLLFLYGVLIYYKFVLISIKEREGVISLSSLDMERRKQMLRVILDTIVVGVLSPLGVLRGGYLKFLGAKIDGFPVLRGKIFNPDLIDIGDGAILGERSMIFGHLLDRNILTLKKVKIGKGVTVGVNCVVSPGVEIGDGAVLAVGTVVSKDTKIPSREIWAGIPAKKIGNVST